MVKPSQTVAAGRSAALRLSASQEKAPLVVTATGPVVVERDLIGPGGVGLSSVAAEPLG
jgi:hypothetical protein